MQACCSTRIVEDRTKFVSNITVIYDAKCIVASEVGNRNGHHHDIAASIRKNNGGKHTQKKQSLQHTPWVHTDAIDGLNVFIENKKRKLTIESPPIEEAQHSDEDGNDSDSNGDSIVLNFSLWEHEDKENNECTGVAAASQREN
jgi:hypothetical protein